MTAGILQMEKRGHESGGGALTLCLPAGRPPADTGMLPASPKTGLSMNGRSARVYRDQEVGVPV